MKQMFLLLLLISYTAFGQDKNISVISVEKGNIVYRGITNKIKIAVPGAKSYKAEAPGTLEKVDSLGNYNWNVTNVSGFKGLIKITATMPDDLVIHEKKEFEIKAILQPRAYINSDYEGRVYEMTRKQLSVAKLKITIDDLLYTFTPKDSSYFIPKSFVLFVSEEKQIKVKGNSMNEEANQLIDQLSIGTIVYINDIEQYNPEEYYLNRLANLKIKIVDGPTEEIMTPEPIISLPNQNFIYRGVENELEIAVPGAKSFKVTAPGLSEYGSGKYGWRVSEINTTTTILDFEIITEKDSVFHIKKEFYIKKAPNLIATLNDRGCNKCIIELVKNDVKDAKISVRPDNYNDSRFRDFNVREYTLVFPEGYEYKVYENTFSASAQKMILQYPVGTIFKIIDIEYRFCGYPPPAPELKFMLVDKY